MNTVTYPDLEKRGRIGNQLWQIAACVGIAERIGGRVKLPAGWSYRPYFEIPDAMFGPSVIRNDLPAWNWACGHIDARQQAYMQCWHYVEDVQDQLREFFAPSGKALLAIHRHLDRTDQWWFRDLVDTEQTVSLSVRRGDNADPVTHPVGTWPLVSMDYYRAALDLFTESEVIVFSDDIEWCEKHLPGELGEVLRGRQLHFVREGPVRPPEYGLTGYSEAPALDWLDLQLMTRTTHHIIANSTFSWWGAFLGRPYGQVVYPNNWVGWRIDQFDFRDLMPDWWVELDNPVDRKHLVRRG